MIDMKEFPATTCSKVVAGACFVTCNSLIIGINIAFIVIGAQSLDMCPLQEMIPIWMVVTGK